MHHRVRTPQRKGPRYGIRLAQIEIDDLAAQVNWGRAAKTGACHLPIPGGADHGGAQVAGPAGDEEARFVTPHAERWAIHSIGNRPSNTRNSGSPVTRTAFIDMARAAAKVSA